MAELGENKRQRTPRLASAAFVLILTLFASTACASTPAPSSTTESTPAVSDEMPPHREGPADFNRFDRMQQPIAELSEDGMTLTISRADGFCLTEPTAFSFDGDSTYAVTFDFVVPNPEGICETVGIAYATEFALASAPAARPVTVEFTGPFDNTVTLIAQ
jgi:hypothetical protein